MKKIKLIAPLLGVVGITGSVVPLASCNNNPDPIITGLEIQGNDIVINGNQSYEYTATVTGEGEFVSAVEWSVDVHDTGCTYNINNNVLTLTTSENGIGNVSITATSLQDDQYSKTLNVNVKDSISPESDQITVGDDGHGEFIFDLTTEPKTKISVSLVSNDTTVVLDSSEYTPSNKKVNVGLSVKDILLEGQKTINLRLQYTDVDGRQIDRVSSNLIVKYNAKKGKGNIVLSEDAKQLLPQGFDINEWTIAAGKAGSKSCEADIDESWLGQLDEKSFTIECKNCSIVFSSGYSSITINISWTSDQATNAVQGNEMSVNFVGFNDPKQKCVLTFIDDNGNYHWVDDFSASHLCSASMQNIVARDGTEWSRTRFNCEIRFFNFNLTTLPSYFLRNCYEFNKPLTLPNSIQHISDYFMWDCSDFQSNLTLPDGLLTIGNDFMGRLTTTLKFTNKLKIPNSVTTIGNNFLYSNSNFDNVIELSSKLENIGNNFLGYCTKLNTSLFLPSSLKSIGENFMGGCKKFERDLQIPKSVESIGAGFFKDNISYDGNLTFEEGSLLTSISNDFMYNCFAFNKSLELPSSVQEIGNNFLSSDGTEEMAFSQDIKISGKIIKIGNNFLSHCANINKLHLLDVSEIKEIGNSFLKGTSNITVEIDNKFESIETIGDNFCYESGMDFEIDLSACSNLISIGENFCGHCSNFKSKLCLPTELTYKNAKIIGKNFLCGQGYNSTREIIDLGCIMADQFIGNDDASFTAYIFHWMKVKTIDFNNLKLRFPDDGTSAPYRQLIEA